MIRKLTILIFSILPFMTNAQTIHWLTFIDTTDENVGEIDKTGREVLYNHFINPINAALNEKGYKTAIQDIHGKDLTPQKCKEVITNLKCAPDDIVIFYYIGHGTHGTEGGEPWPMMLMGQLNPDYFIPLKWVNDKLIASGAKLTASIGMCCNVYQGVKRRIAPSFGVNYGNTSLTEMEIESIQKMFLEKKGNFLLSSASPGQSSLGGETPFGEMDIFTCVLVKNFEDNAYDGTLDWNTLFSDVRDVINQETEGKQTPIFVSNLSRTTASSTPKPTPKPVVVTPPTTATSTASSNQEWMNRIGVALDNLIDIRQKETTRIAQASELENIFTPNAVVRVMSQDGNFVIDKSSADDFIGRLATSRILLKVAPVDIVVNDRNKISELKVKEIYKK